MIDKLFGTIEDIYFMVVSDTKSETQTVIEIDEQTSNLQETLQLFKDKAKDTMYIGKDGNKYRLLKVAVQILNYVMHEDDGIYSEDEQQYMSEYIGNKFTRFTEDEQTDLRRTMLKRVSLDEIITLTKEHEITLRPIDMLLDKIVVFVKDQPKYHLPLCTVLQTLMEASNNG